MKNLFIIFIIIISSSTNGYPCSCGELSKLDIEEYHNAGEVFVGKVISVIENKENWEVEITLEVIEQLKPTETNRKITIITAFGGAMCGISAQIGEKWYVFTNYNDKGQLRAGLCGRSVNLDKKFKIKELGLQYAYLGKKYWRKNKRRYRKEKRFIKKSTELTLNSSPILFPSFF